MPQGISQEEFLKGYSFPKNPELMRVFKDLDLVEQLGTGIIRILQSYDKSVYEFSENFIRVNFKFRKYSELVNKNANNNFILSETQKKIIELIKDNASITQIEISKKLNINDTTVMRNLKVLKNNNIIKRVGSTKNGQWIIT